MYCVYHVLMCCAICLCNASYQFAHAALLSHSILTFVVQAHLAGFAAEAVFCSVSRQEHHMLSCCTCTETEKEGSDLTQIVILSEQQITHKRAKEMENTFPSAFSFIYSMSLHTYS